MKRSGGCRSSSGRAARPRPGIAPRKRGQEMGISPFSHFGRKGLIPASSLSPVPPLLQALARVAGLGFLLSRLQVAGVLDRAVVGRELVRGLLAVDLDLLALGHQHQGLLAGHRVGDSFTCAPRGCEEMSHGAHRVHRGARSRPFSGASIAFPRCALWTLWQSFTSAGVVGAGPENPASDRFSCWLRAPIIGIVENHRLRAARRPTFAGWHAT